MRYLQNIRVVWLFALAVILPSCGGKEKVIREETFAQIIGEMYLADQFVDQNPPLRAQTDTAALYDAIFLKHGYTREDYQASVQYYLQKGSKYKDVHQQARNLLSEREKELNKILELQRGIVKDWWATDTARVIPVEKLEQDPYLRAIKWLMIKEIKTEWTCLDSIVRDIPQNIYWWKNNSRLLHGDSLSLKQGILVKEEIHKDSTLLKKKLEKMRPLKPESR